MDTTKAQRIAQLEAEVADLKRQLAELDKPVGQKVKPNGEDRITITEEGDDDGDEEAV